MSASLANAASGGGSAADSLRGSSIVTNSPSSVLMSNLSTNAALFREIHKNTWLKRLTADGKRVTVGPKKSEKSWVVFCVHDDTQALLEGYAEPRQAASHNPEWIVSMQGTQHISHALIPNSHEFEFVVTLHNEVVRFHAMSWEVMQEWVETLRSKLREMKILSPRENLYTKLPEIRAPLLPTRDPTSPLPAPPPVPAALVPGIERVVPHSLHHSPDVTNADLFEDTNVERTIASGSSCTIITTSTTTLTQSTPNLPLISTSQFLQTPVISSMSNTLTQNLLNMLSDPIIAYSEQLLEDDLDVQPNSGDEATNITTIANNSSISNLEKQSNDCRLDLVSEREVNFDVGFIGSTHFDQNENLDDFILHERLIPRPHTSRSLSAGAADQECRQLAYKSTLSQNNSKTSKSTNINNITELEIGAVDEIANKSHIDHLSINATSTSTDSLSNVTIIKLTNSNHEINSQANCDVINCPNSKMKLDAGVGEIFRYPDKSIIKHEDQYKSNVQIIPSSLNSSTIQVVSGLSTFTTSANQQYSTPAMKNNAIQTILNTDDAATIATTTQTSTSSPRSHLENHQITTVHVGSDKSCTYGSLYGTCFSSSEATTQQFTKSPILPNKIIVPANSLGVTNISVNNEEEKNSCDSMPQNRRATNDNDTRQNAISSVRYEKVFLSSSTPLVTKDKTQALPSGKENTSQIATRMPASPKFPLSSQQRAEATTIKYEGSNPLFETPSSSSLPSSPIPRVSFSGADTKKQKPAQHSASQNSTNTSDDSQQQKGSRSLNKCKEMNTALLRSPAMQRKSNVAVVSAGGPSSSSSVPAPAVPIRTRYLTRGLTEAIITTRPSRKDLCLLKTSTKPKTEINSNSAIAVSSNNNIEDITSSISNSANPSQIEVNSARSEQPLEQRRRSSSTSEAQSQRGRAVNNNEFISNRLGMNAVVRMQPPPHSIAHTSAAAAGASAAKRMTLREQQVMQLRREIMHPGGVRLQLRRKDCLGSVAWVDAFGAVWIAGWKQKEHPVLYNALHIGDQLVSIAGVTVCAAADANKIIRNTNTLFVEVVIRRIPLGRGYAIRREREGQCLGLIRDGNTATIVDVVPNSLAARHGLPPKAQSCDGSTLTFWVLTEINARPLNLFFKEHEIRDRLNSVGRDISILVQPSDLIVKLKKQLKSLRSYKDYLVQ